MPANSAAPAPFQNERTTFAVDIGAETSQYAVLAFTALPGETVSLVIPMAAVKGENFIVGATDAPPPLRNGDSRTWKWVAPQVPGAYLLTITRERTLETMRLPFFVLTPAGEIENGALNGYRMGAYPDKPLRGNAIYLAPRGFIEVTAKNRELEVAPHFRLEQFLCKQSGGYPKYLALSTRLLRKLEFVLEKLNDAGIRADSLFVMSGFRTPEYNAALRDTPYSRHQWGDAADIYIDSNGDGRIDDINGDGKSDDRDSEFLNTFIEALSAERAYAPFEGGLGVYRASSSHPPFVHVDTRGFRARWRE